jgi:regulatory protein
MPFFLGLPAATTARGSNGECGGRPGRVKRGQAFADLRGGGIVAVMSDDDHDGGTPPDPASLHAAAVAYLARYSATRATLARALNRQIDRWLRAASGPEAAVQAAAAKRAVPDIVAKLVGAGAVDDAAFAASRAKKLTRTGHSRRASAAHLAARGVPAELVRTALPEDDASELAAAVTYLRRRRLGPFRATEPTPETKLRELGSLARAGFASELARRAVALTRDEAELLLLAARAEK